MRTNKFHIIGSILLGVLIGFLSTQFSYFKFQSELSLIDLVNLIVTAFIAWYITSYLQKKQNQDGVEKEIIISELKKTQEEITSIYSDVLSSNLDFNSTINKFKMLSMKINSVIEIYETCSHYSTENIRSIQLKITTNKGLITGSTVAANNTLTVTSTHRSVFVKNTKEINRLIIKEIIAINRAN